MAKGLCTFLSKTFWLSLLLGTVSINSHAEELYPWQLAGDSLLLFKGTTYRYTVDTPENQGLVSTLPTVTELKKQLADSGVGTFRLLTANGQEKTEGVPEGGDYLLAASSRKRMPSGVSNI